MSRPLDSLVREAREDWGIAETKAISWDGVDEALFQRIARERRAEEARFAAGPPPPWVFAAASLVALALIVAIGVGKNGDTSLMMASSDVETAGAIATVEAGGRVLVNGVNAVRGTTLHLGDVIEARGAPFTFERPGKVTVLVERGARVRVSHVRGALVLALEEGAVEARVVPVETGEAFGVDIGTSRVAVHGTHLRVARAEQRAIVDLSEGVVSLGGAPRAGSVVGTLIVAPAHAEFDIANAAATLAVSHDLSTVRVLTAFTPASSAPAPVVLAARPSVRIDPPAPRAPSTASVRVEGRTSTPPSPAPSALEQEPESLLASTVLGCMAGERPRSENITVLVYTTLTLTLHDDGSVQSARFDPPVLPEVNECAAPAIYKAHFTHGGTVSVPINFKY